MTTKCSIRQNAPAPNHVAKLHTVSVVISTTIMSFPVSQTVSLGCFRSEIASNTIFAEQLAVNQKYDKRFNFSAIKIIETTNNIQPMTVSGFPFPVALVHVCALLPAMLVSARVAVYGCHATAAMQPRRRPQPRQQQLPP